ncbi:MAG: hypothetical protein M1531_00365 [Chloroflexi bacterium]|nr:hypothetical protein [Chloroflexota bacterium]
MGVWKLTAITAMVIFLLLGNGLLLVAPASAAGVGVAPASIELYQALRGAEYDKVVMVLNPEPQETSYTLSTSGEGGAWIRFYEKPDSPTPIQRVTVPPSGNKQLVARFNIPQQAANGTYEARILVTTAPVELPKATGKTEDQQGQTVAIQAQARVRVEVTGNQILRATAEGITAPDTEVNYPVRLTAGVSNKGNVAVKPRLTAEIYEGTLPAGKYEHNSTTVKPDSLELIHIDADTVGWRAGDYVAKVKVSIAGSSNGPEEVIAQEDVNFKLLPIGTLTRAGELRELTSEGMPVVGNVLKIAATFANTGQIETPATLVGEIRRDGVLVGILESRGLSVLKNQLGQLVSYFKLEEPGNYSISAQVDYGGKLTSARELSFKAVPVEEALQPTQAKEVSSSNTWIMLASVEGIAVLALIIGVFLMLGRRAKSGRVA